STVVLLSDGQELGSQATYGDALKNLQDNGVRVISVGLNSRFYNSKTLKNVALATQGSYTEAQNSGQLTPSFSNIGAELATQYDVPYRSLLPRKDEAKVTAKVAGLAKPATATYTTPTLDFSPRGTFDESWMDKVIMSPWLMVFVVVSVLGLLAFAVLAVI